MSDDLKRLLDETESETERALLYAGRSYRSSRETWVKTLTAVGLAGSTAVVAGTANAAASLVPFAKLTGIKVLLGLSAVGAVAAVPIGYRAWHHSPVPISVAVGGVAGRRPEPPSPMLTEEARVGAVPADAIAGVADVNADDTDWLPSATAKSSSAVASSAGSSARGTGPAAKAARSSVSLAQELGALDAVRSMLGRGDAQGALFLLDGYARTCHHGKLEIEAELLRIDALAKSGQGREASQRAASFLKRHPSSVLALRARTYLDD